jgi:glycosyltransferase involved in cell wall biosynthesis
MIWYKRFFKEISQNFSIKFTNYIYCVSNATSHDLTYLFGRESNGVFNPLVDYGFFNKMAKNERLYEFKYFCVLGTIEPRKNIFNLLAAYKNIIARGYLLPKLVLIGGKGWKNKQLHSLIESGIADGTILYLGFLDNALLPQVYGGCEFFIMPSVYEGFGIPILEAQYSGAPVVHGVHSSMCEASADVSLKIETDIRSIEQFFISFSKGLAQLHCRYFKNEDLLNKNKLEGFLGEIKSIVKQICYE